ncbi:hypothetical protein JOF41_006366 [Saccharothrix coeruleofusca]|uniref:fibronectin type III domain-containing protein n=1 Tax=Saccharothrix coeruleofusca TaxID=33919 RepID=UPI001AE1B7BA|nr:fibronectin type III domain-containing protein [Saccharothrix coeruleofusca]MBP2340188.1 hypothetical protein [Saccharothrix coeruleofusca]
MDRRGFVAVAAGVALLGGTIAVLRQESAPPPPDGPFARFLAEGVGHSTDEGSPATPTDLALTALDLTSLRVGWRGTATGGYEVRWADRVRLVRATETELTGLPPNADVRVEVRALDPLGRRSAPATAEAVPRLAHDPGWADPLVHPVDRFDGPEALAPRRWRVLDDGVADCLGLTGAADKRLRITCDRVDLQSNVPVRLSPPHPDGAVARVVLTTDGPSGLGAVRDAGEIVVALLPEPFHDSGPLTDPLPPGAVALRVGERAAGFTTGEGVPATTRRVPVTGQVRPPVSGVRHRWELRVLPDALVALVDGEVVAAAPVAVPWTAARARLAFRGSRFTQVDSFGVGGVPAPAEASSLVLLGPGTPDGDDAVSLGHVPAERLAGGTSVRVVAAVGAAAGARLTVRFGDRSAPARVVGTDMFGTLVHADFPLPAPGGAQVRVLGDGVGVLRSHLVVSDGPDAVRPLPRLLERETPGPRAPEPVTAVTQRSGRAEVVVELTAPRGGEIAAVDGVEVDLDGERVAAVPTGGAVGGRHVFTLDLGGLSTGGHRVAVRAVPVDRRLETRLAEEDFQIRPL